MGSKFIFNKLSKIYHNPADPGSLGGVERLFKRAKELGITKDKNVVKEYLTTQHAYSYHKPIRKNLLEIEQS